MTNGVEDETPLPAEAIEPPGTEPTAGGRLNRARRAMRGYYRWLRLSRLAFAACVILAGFFLAWVTPWLPSGLDAKDYTPKVAFTIYLLSGTALVGLLALAFREFARRDREAIMVWANVYDESTGLHTRNYLYDRLSLECERAGRSGTIFSIIVVQVRTGDGGNSARALSRDALQHIAQVIDGLVHPTDPVALLAGNELAVLAVRVGHDERKEIEDRLRQAVAAELPSLLGAATVIDVKAGSSTYGSDGRDPGSLVQAARLAAVMSSPKRTQAA